LNTLGGTNPLYRFIFGIGMYFTSLTLFISAGKGRRR
jgi:hypothetical protein